MPLDIPTLSWHSTFTLFTQFLAISAVPQCRTYCQHLSTVKPKVQLWDGDLSRRTKADRSSSCKRITFSGSLNDVWKQHRHCVTAWLCMPPGRTFQAVFQWQSIRGTRCQAFTSFDIIRVESIQSCQRQEDVFSTPCVEVHQKTWVMRRFERHCLESKCQDQRLQNLAFRSKEHEKNALNILNKYIYIILNIKY